MADIFEIISKSKNGKDLFTKIKEKETTGLELDSLGKSLTSIIKKYVDANKYTPPPPVDFEEEIQKRLPPPIDIEALKKEIEKKVLKSLPPPQPQVIIEKHTEKVIEKDDKPSVDNEARKLISEIRNQVASGAESLKVIETLKKEIESLTSELKSVKETAERPLFIPAPPIIPSWANQSGKYLTNKNGQLKWGSVVSGGTTITLSDTPSTPSEGDWRFSIDGNNLLTQRYESGTWVEKATFEP